MLVTALIGVTTTFALEGVIKGSWCQDVKIISDTGYHCHNYDPEGIICNNYGQPDEAYCSFGIGSLTCAYCASPCARNEKCKQCGAKGSKRPDVCCAGYVCNDFKKCVFQPVCGKENKKARACGWNWIQFAEECCEGFVCDKATKGRCVKDISPSGTPSQSPSSYHPIGINRTIYVTQEPTNTTSADISPTETSSQSPSSYHPIGTPSPYYLS